MTGQPNAKELSARFEAFTEEHDLGQQGDAVELFTGRTFLTREQRAWLYDFINEWEAAEEANPEFWTVP